MSVYSGVSANISCGKLKLSSSSCETFRFEFFGLLACPIYFMLIFLCLLSLAAFYSHLAMTCQACRRLISSHGDDYNKIFAFFFFLILPSQLCSQRNVCAVCGQKSRLVVYIRILLNIHLVKVRLLVSSCGITVFFRPQRGIHVTQT